MEITFIINRSSLKKIVPLIKEMSLSYKEFRFNIVKLEDLNIDSKIRFIEIEYGNINLVSGKLPNILINLSVTKSLRSRRLLKSLRISKEYHLYNYTNNFNQLIIFDLLRDVTKNSIIIKSLTEVSDGENIEIGFYGKDTNKKKLYIEGLSDKSNYITEEAVVIFDEIICLNEYCSNLSEIKDVFKKYFPSIKIYKIVLLKIGQKVYLKQVCPLNTKLDITNRILISIVNEVRTHVL